MVARDAPRMIGTATMRLKCLWPDTMRQTLAVDRPERAAAFVAGSGEGPQLRGAPLLSLLSDAGQCRALAATLTSVSLTMTGGGQVVAALGLPDRRPAPLVVLIHEWWGLTDQIKAMAVFLAEAGYVTLAVDLLDGRVASSVDEAASLSAKVHGAAARETLARWIHWGRALEQCSGRVGVLGWCFGGGLALMASLATPVDATVIYCGLVMGKAPALKALKGPVMGHFGLADEFVPWPMIAGFTAEMQAADRVFHRYLYDAGHGFANPSGTHHHPVAATLAWRRTEAFLAETLWSGGMT